MANSVAAFFQALVAASSDANSVLVGTTALMDAVYLDYSPIAAAPFQTLDIPIPASVTSQVTNIGTGTPNFEPVAATTKPVTLNQHPQYGYVISDFEQYTSAEQLRKVFIDPAIKGVAESCNASIAGLLNSTACNVNAVISTTGSAIQPAQYLVGWTNLANNKVSVMDAPNMAFIQPPTLYGSALGNNNWTQESIASAVIAEAARLKGEMRAGYGATTAFDQQMPVSGSAGSYVYTSAYFHRYGIALVSRPLPAAPNDGQTLFCTFTKWKGFSIRITLQYLVNEGGWVVSVDAGYGVAVIRPEMVQLFSTAE